MSTFLYNPERKTKQQLIAEFVVRTNVFRDIMQDIEASGMKYPEQHYLLVGPRGSGKTTLLTRIKYAVEDSRKLHKRVIPVLFSEEQYNISELADLWENIAQVLEDHYDFKGLVAEMQNHSRDDEFEEIAYTTLENALKKRRKKILLLIDNIGDVLGKFDEMQVRRLREVLQTKPYIRIVAGSPSYLGMLIDYKYPLFEFFKVIFLDELSMPESFRLLKKLGTIHGKRQTINNVIRDQPGRVLTLMFMTRRSPRMIASMFRIIADHPEESCMRDLERILDIVTPLYKHKMDNLTAQQQKIVDAIAKNWDAVTVKELVTKVRIDKTIIGEQIRELEQKQILEITDAGKRDEYRLQERIFNIWYLMRYGGKYEREALSGFVNFSEYWWTCFDVERRVTRYIEKDRRPRTAMPAALLYTLSDVIGSLGKEDVVLKILRDAFVDGLALYISNDRALSYARDAAFLNFMTLALKIIYHENPDLIKTNVLARWPAFMPVCEPMHQALQIIDGQMNYSRIPPEKVELIRNIVERITSND